MLTIDGTHGGGGILRNALGLSVITQQPFRIIGIRAGRSVPGLKHEHLHCIRVLQHICSAKASGVGLGSQEVEFFPGPVKACTVRHDLETAASTTLVAHALILATLFSGKRVRVTLVGGTDVRWSIPSDYLAHVLRPLLLPYGSISVSITQRGYYPKGRGELDIVVRGKGPGSPITPLALEKTGQLLGIKGSSHASTELEARNVAARQAGAARALLKQGVPVDIQETYSATSSPGSLCTLWARFEQGVIGAGTLGERGVSAEEVGSAAAKELLALIKQEAPVDPHLADQLIPFLAVTGGSIRTGEITKHALGSIYVANQFLPAVEVEGTRIYRK